MVAPSKNWKLPAAQAHPSGRHSRLEEIVEVHGPAMRRMLKRMLGDDEEVHDVYQDCICHLAGRWTERGMAVQPLVQNAGAYAYQTAANLAVETIRRRRRRASHWQRVVVTTRQQQDPHAHDPARRAGSTPPRRIDALRDAVSALPGHLRNVVILRDLVGLPYGRVGEMLGIQPTTARVYRRQAIVRLGGMLAPGS
ncbi:MAG: RNA polymerase sigma factor [Planctomycetota bacterium]